MPLLDLLLPLMSDRPRFVLFTCHTLGFSPPLMKNLLVPWRDRFGGQLEAGTMVMKSAACKCVLPTGFFARWSMPG
jgi:23S rRNA (cytosine1962-C5)-methyltransferase